MNRRWGAVVSLIVRGLCVAFIIIRTGMGDTFFDFLSIAIPAALILTISDEQYPCSDEQEMDP